MDQDQYFLKHVYQQSLKRRIYTVWSARQLQLCWVLHNPLLCNEIHQLMRAIEYKVLLEIFKEMKCHAGGGKENVW